MTLVFDCHHADREILMCNLIQVLSWKRTILDSMIQSTVLVDSSWPNSRTCTSVMSPYRASSICPERSRHGKRLHTLTTSSSCHSRILVVFVSHAVNASYIPRVCIRGKVYGHMKKMHDRFACTEYRNAIHLMEQHCGYSVNSIPQVQDISNFLMVRVCVCDNNNTSCSL